MAEIGTWEIVALVAGSSVLAVVVNHGVSLASRWLARKQDRNFGRLYLALSLEEYGATCGDTIGESETYDASHQQAGSSRTNIPPLPPYPDEVDWRALGLAATNRLLSFRVEVESIRAQLRESLEHDVDSTIEDTRTYAAEMGLKAIDIAGALRAEAGAPMPPLDLEWSIVEYLESKRDEYMKMRRARSAAAASATVEAIAQVVPDTAQGSTEAP